MKPLAPAVLAAFAIHVAPGPALGEDASPPTLSAVSNVRCMQMSVQFFSLAFIGLGQPMMHGVLMERQDAPTAFGAPPLPTFPDATEDYPELVAQVADGLREWAVLFPPDPDLSEAFDVVAEHYRQAATASSLEDVKHIMETPENTAAWETIATVFQRHIEEECAGYLVEE